MSASGPSGPLVKYNVRFDTSCMSTVKFLLHYFWNFDQKCVCAQRVLDLLFLFLLIYFYVVKLSEELRYTCFFAGMIVLTGSSYTLLSPW